MRSRWLGPLFAAPLIALCPPVGATVISSTLIGPPQITLSDLDPHDGITPAVLPGGYIAPDFNIYLGPTSVDPIIIGPATLGGSNGALNGKTEGPGASFFGLVDYYAPSFNFTVTANTRVTLSATYSLTGSVQGESLLGVDQPRAFASLDLTLVAVNQFAVPAGQVGATYAVLGVYDQVANIDSDDGTWTNGHQTRTGTLSLSFDNLSATPAVFAFRAEEVVFGQSSDVPAVPEPSAAGLLIGGIAATIGWQQSRRWRTA